jgi:hypothetical protein
VRTAAALVVTALLVLAGSAVAADTAADPVVGLWKVMRGGSGTIRIHKVPGIYAVSARTNVKLGCLRTSAKDLVGFVELRSKTNLPQGVYSANLGPEGRGCNYAVRLRITGGTAVGKVIYSEEGKKGGPFSFRRVG